MSNEYLVQREAGLVHLLVYELAVNDCLSDRVGNRCRSRQRLNGKTFAVNFGALGCWASKYNLWVITVLGTGPSVLFDLNYLQGAYDSSFESGHQSPKIPCRVDITIGLFS